MGLKLASFLSVTALFALVYAVVFAIMFWFLGTAWWSLLLMIAFTVMIILIQYGISPYLIQWIYDIEWIDYDQYKARYPHLANTLDKVVNINKINMPRLGIIHDKNPNAFTFGHTKNNARVVLTQGILEFLDDDEQNAVLAHELGHVIHSDFILMTIVFAIPMILYTIARWAYYASFFRRGRSGDSDEAAAIGLALIAIAALSYLAYYIGSLIALIVSRIREYYADEHSAELLENPNHLATGLVKIAYGLVADQGLSIEERNKSRVRGLKGLGIFDPSDAKHLAVESVGKGGAYSMDAIEAAAAWDLYNPWAKYFQIFSTHPLPAKRIQRLNQQCEEFGIQPEIDLSKAKKIKEEQAGKSMAGEFLTDLFFKYLPTILFILFIVFTVFWLLDLAGLIVLPFGLGVSVNNFLLIAGIWFYVIGFGYIARTQFMYRSGFKPMKVVDLMTKVKASPVRSIPAIIEGKIIGKGIPGYYFSDDIYFQDDTGLLYIDYRFGIGLVDFFWSIRRVPQLIGQNARIKGWFRRGPSPFLQVDTIEVSDRSFRNYSKHLTYIGAVICFIIGAVLFYFWFI
ncbi:MAG: M48 family metalloprotease [Candidatus Lokiarchaeota archaeon]|nr:M48 family metalloprotease [Candidatus Lokiarchaeota archaeon]